MQTYAQVLNAYLAGSAVTQTDFAGKIGRTQPAVHRYCEGTRFPDAMTARDIDAATEGQVPFALWQAEFMAKAGLGGTEQQVAA